MINASSTIDGVLLIPLKVINVPGGDVLHGMKSSDLGYMGFGEAYFSKVEPGAVKAWKRHHVMTLNLVVPVGTVHFVIYDEQQDSANFGKFQEVVLSEDNYCRLTIPPMMWVGFRGVSKSTAILLNIADIEHSPDEVERKELNEIKYNWEVIK